MPGNGRTKNAYGRISVGAAATACVAQGPWPGTYRLTRVSRRAGARSTGSSFLRVVVAGSIVRPGKVDNALTCCTYIDRHGLSFALTSLSFFLDGLPKPRESLNGCARREHQRWRVRRQARKVFRRGSLLFQIRDTYDSSRHRSQRSICRSGGERRPKILLTRRVAHPVGNGTQLLNVRPSAAVRCRSRLFPLLAANAVEGFPHIGLDAGYVTECRVKDGLQRAPPDSVQATRARARRSSRRAR